MVNSYSLFPIPYFPRTLFNYHNLCRITIYLASLFSLILIIFSILLSDCNSVQAATISENQNYLTIKILEERLDNLVKQEGVNTIDLSKYIIDFTPQANNFRNQFYQQIKTKISRTQEPIALDLSDTIIQGDFNFSQLGIATTLAEGALSSLITPTEQEQIKQYYPLSARVNQPIKTISVFRGILKLERTIFTATADFADSLFLQPVLATDTNFQQLAKFSNSIFGQTVDLSAANFNLDVNFDFSHFFQPTKFNLAQFQGVANFSNSNFEQSVEFKEAIFGQLTDFSRSVFWQPANFTKTIWRDRLLFSKSKFLDSVIFTNATFEKNIVLRDVYVASTINFQDVNLLNRVDFSNAFFTNTANINVAGLAFDSAEAKIIGEIGTIGNLLVVDRYQGNETVLRNLVRNFRSLEQIADANQIEYQREKLILQQLSDRLIKLSWQRIFSITFISQVLNWLSLSLLLLLGNYGTNVNLVFNVGLVAIAFFSLLFWLIDRYRPGISQPIIPNRYETICMVGSYLTLTVLGIINIFITTDKPYLTLACLAIVLIPIPISLLLRLYWQGRYHKLLNLTYFVQDGSFRQFRLLLGRLPIMPLFPFCRDRYQPILWSKRWNWLNYYDFSLNNILKFGFNDIRLRDEHMPGIIATLVWYQWCLGVLYIILLLWTLSRTIPGLNLLIYF